MEVKVAVMIMSGVDDGSVLNFSSASGDGAVSDSQWTLKLGRREDNDICLRNDTFVSREHARLNCKDEQWWLEDLESKNGTFVEDVDEDAKVQGTVAIQPGQLFRVGRTWLRIQPIE